MSVIQTYDSNGEIVYANVAEPMKHTNADRIRAMTDEELAKKISGIEQFALTVDGAWSPEQWLDWLKQEAQPGGCETIQREEKADNVYDRCERHEGCTVEIWSNSETGKTSVGWWQP